MFKTLSTDSLKERLEREPATVVINVLDEQYFNQEHIPGSINIPLDSPDFTQRVEEALSGDRNRPVVVYCANLECTASPTAARWLDEAGFAQVYDYEEGMRGWKQAGLQIESAGAERR